MFSFDMMSITTNFSARARVLLFGGSNAGFARTGAFDNQRVLALLVLCVVSEIVLCILGILIISICFNARVRLFGWSS
jgi:arginine exporter protein ArgO